MVQRARAWLCGVVGILALCTCVTAVAAPGYPDRPIKLIVPYPPGGGIDPAARIFAQALGDELGQPIVILNESGASGQIGTLQVARASADGYTLLFASVAPNSILPAISSKLPYSNRNFAGISLVGSAPYVLVGNPSVPASNIQELLQLIKTDPAKIDRFSSSGPLGGPHLAGELFGVLTNHHLTHVPYRGDGPSVVAILAGEVPIGFSSAPSVVAYVKSGKLKAFGVSGDHRSPLLPDLPALAQTLPGLDVSQWYGLMAPAATPKDIIARVNQAAVKVLSTPKLRDQLEALGIEPKPLSPAEFDRFVDGEMRKYKALVQKAKLTDPELASN
jgi:tripartite-type tricarboxylate transporter receptor subunit TctC